MEPVVQRAGGNAVKGVKIRSVFLSSAGFLWTGHGVFKLLFNVLLSKENLKL